MAAIRALTRPSNKKFLGNSNSKIVHDLDSETAQCQIDEIISAGNAVTFVPDALDTAHVDGYVDGTYCLAVAFGLEGMSQRLVSRVRYLEKLVERADLLGSIRVEPTALGTREEGDPRWAIRNIHGHRRMVAKVRIDRGLDVDRLEDAEYDLGPGSSVDLGDQWYQGRLISWLVVDVRPRFNVAAFAKTSEGELVATTVEGYVIRIDMVTGEDDMVKGEAIVLSDPFLCPGPPLEEPSAIVEIPDGSLVVVDAAKKALVRVDPVNGDRTIFSDAATGSGQPLEGPLAMVLASDGNLVVTDPPAKLLIQVDPATGNRSPLPDGGTPLEQPFGIAAAGDGSLWVTDTQLQALVKVDPVSGNKEIISSEEPTGTGSAFSEPEAVAVAPDLTVMVTDNERGVIVQVDPDSGRRTPVPKVLLDKLKWPQRDNWARASIIQMLSDDDLAIAEGTEVRLIKIGAQRVELLGSF